MNTKKFILGLGCIFIVFSFVIALLVTSYVKPKHESGTTESLNAIKELKGILDSFPNIGEIKYVRRIQAGTVGIFFIGKAMPEEVTEYCDQQVCIKSPAKEYRQIWQDRLSLYQLPENDFSVSFRENDFHFDGPESLRKNNYRISFLYMPNEGTFIGEVFFFR